PSRSSARDAEMKPDGERDHEQSRDEKIQVLYPAKPPRRERADGLRDLAVIRLNDTLYDDQKREPDRCDDARQREFFHGDLRGLGKALSGLRRPRSSVTFADRSRIGQMAHAC